MRQAGLAALVAPQVANSGTINAQLGHVVLAGAKTATLDLYGDGLLSLDVTNQVTEAPVGADGKKVTALVTNTGVVIADGGTVQLTARAADGIVQNLVQAGGKIRAATMGDQTGTIALNGVGGSIVVEGQLAAPGRAPGTRGGAIEVVSNGNVTVASSARINASGKAGGGMVAIGTTLARAKDRGHFDSSCRQYGDPERCHDQRRRHGQRQRRSRGCAVGEAHRHGRHDHREGRTPGWQRRLRRSVWR